MKMIANSRLKAAQQKTEKSRPFVKGALSFLEYLPKTEIGKRNTIIPVHSDRGLCGGVNSNIGKATKNLISERTREHADFSYRMTPLGDKATGIYSREFGNRVSFICGDLGKKPFGFATASHISEKILEDEFDSATIIYNRFVSAISFAQEIKNIPSFTKLMAFPERVEYDTEGADDDQQFLDLTEFHIASGIYGAYIESACSELSARMAAMDSASKNAGEMLKILNVFLQSKKTSCYYY